MSDKMEWDDKYLVGIDILDEQHQEVFSIVNELYDLIKSETDKEKIIAAIEHLDKAISVHFDTEEAFLAKYNYDKRDEMKKSHDYFKHTYSQLRNNYFFINFDKSPKDNVLNIYILLLARTLKEWLHFHIQTYDKDFADFYKKLESN